VPYIVAQLLRSVPGVVAACAVWGPVVAEPPVAKATSAVTTSMAISTSWIANPAVREVAVFGKPDSKWGEIVKACVLKSGKTLTADQLIA
jgi:acyl-CoA synthetase (AMP-forming)/AMP-acid ligase II